MKNLSINLEEKNIENLTIFLIVHEKRVEVFRLSKKIAESEKRRALYNLLRKLNLKEGEEFLLCHSKTGEEDPIFVFDDKEIQFSEKNQKSFEKCDRTFTEIGDNFLSFLKSRKLSEYQDKTYFELHELENFPRGVFSKLNNELREEYNEFLKKQEIQKILTPLQEKSKWTLNQYWGVSKEDSSEEDFVSVESSEKFNISTDILDPIEFSKLYETLFLNWVKLSALLSYLYGFNTNELQDLTYEKIKSFVNQTQNGLTEKEFLRAKLGNSFKSKYLNYQNEILKECFHHFVLCENKTLFSKNGKKMNKTVALRNLKQELTKEGVLPVKLHTKLLVLRYHAIVHYLYYSKSKKITAKTYEISEVSIHYLCEEMEFCLEELVFVVN